MSCKITFDYIAQWVDPNFFFSKNHKWGNMGIIGVLGDFILHSVGGDILEIGVGESSIYLTALSKKYNRKIYYCDCNNDKIVDIKGADYFSENSKIYVCLSDEMFAEAKLTPLAFTFIDGYHGYDQVKRDFWNAMEYTVSNGCILMHDTYPPKEDWQDGGGCGDVYRFRQEIEKDKRFDCFTFVGNPYDYRIPDYYIASTLVRKKPENRPYYQE